MEESYHTRTEKFVPPQEQLRRSIIRELAYDMINLWVINWELVHQVVQRHS